MKQKIIVAQAAQKTSDKTGKQFLAVIDNNGNKYTCWEVNDFGDFIPNQEVEVEITQKGNFANIKTANKPHSYQPRQDKVIQYQVNKAENIRQAQDRTSESVKISSSARDATLILTAFESRYSAFSEEQLQEEWKKWRKWLFRQYDVGGTGEPFI